MPKEPTSGQAANQPGPAGNSDNPGGTAPASQPRDPAGRRQAARGHMIGERKKRYLVAPRQPRIEMGPLGVLPMAFQPLPLPAVEQALRASGDVEVIGIVGGRRATGAMGEGMAAPAEGVLVARMTDRRAQELLMQGQGRLLVERDQHLRPFGPVLRQPRLVASLAPRPGPALSLAVEVTDPDGRPVPDAEVALYGSLMSACSITGADGKAGVTVYGEQPDTIRGLYVKPKSDFWSFYQRDPGLSADAPNLITLRPLSDWRGLSGFPSQATTGWGARAMRIHELPPELRGRGVKIAIIDSGAATSHACLKHLSQGIDLRAQAEQAGWSQDPLGHGSHAAGIIGAADPAFGMRGIAPDAEIHACKLLPGGQISQLIEALEYCIAHQIDVVSLGIGVPEPCEALEQQILRAKRFGVACVAATGNSGNAVQYPASSAHVLAVAAIGKTGEFPPDSFHGETTNGDADANGYFTTRFSCYGPRVDVCAPGVAVISSVPPNNFTPWDGTSAATAHVAGLAALLLAHHPLFQGAGRAANADRVERLFQVIRMSARRVTLGQQSSIGYGLPDAVAALAWPMMVGELHGMQQAMASMAGFAPGVEAFGQPSALGQLAAMPFGVGGMRSRW